MRTQVRHLLHIPGRSEVTAVELPEGETLLTVVLHGHSPKATDLAATMIAVADQYPDAIIEFIEPVEGAVGGAWAFDLVATSDL